MHVHYSSINVEDALLFWWWGGGVGKLVTSRILDNLCLPMVYHIVRLRLRARGGSTVRGGVSPWLYSDLPLNRRQIDVEHGSCGR